MSHIDIHQQTLANGLRVIVCPDHSAPILTVNVMYHVGSFDEQPHRTGLAHLFEHLMFDNTSTGMEKQYERLSARAGATSNAYTNYDQTAYHITLPKHQLDIGLWLEAERMRSFQIDERSLITQRKVVIEEIKQQVLNQPYARWQFATDAAAYASDCHYSWHVYGDPDHVANTSMDDARDFYQRFYTPDNAVLCVAGDCEPEDVYARANAQFGSIPRAPQPPTRTTINVAQLKHGVHSIEKDSVPTAAIFVSVHMPGQCHDEILVADLVSSLIGVGRASILYRELVKNRRIASTTASFIDRRAQSSLLTIIIYAIDENVSPDMLADALESVLQGASVSQADLSRVVNRQRTALAMELQRTDGVADSVNFYATFKNDPNEVNNLLQKYSAVKLEEVNALMTRVANKDQWIRVDIIPND